ncbi:MAG: hypothetical protein E7142_05255 [Rikenellaceae bacterium]|nr:hypothetical protein [Rikenellaceae bacterium]
MRRFWFVLSLTLFSLVITACEKLEFDPDNPYGYFEQFIHRKLPKHLPEHWFFDDGNDVGFGYSYRANSCVIYFLDEQGNNLINPDDRSTWPVPCYKDEYVADPDSFYDDYYLHSPRSNRYMLFAPVEGRHIMTYPLRFRGRDYEIKFEYLYTDKGISGGSGMYANIFRCKLEDRFIFSDFENPQKKNIIVVLDKDGDIVSLQREEVEKM